MTILNRIALVPLAKEIRAADPGLLSLFYAHNAAFGSLARQSAQSLKLLVKRGMERVYFTEPSKPLLILDTPGKEEATKREFDMEGLTLNYIFCSRYLGAYLGLQKELEAWVKPQVEAWAHGL